MYSRFSLASGIHSILARAGIRIDRVVSSRESQLRLAVRRSVSFQAACFGAHARLQAARGLRGEAIGRGRRRLLSTGAFLDDFL